MQWCDCMDEGAKQIDGVAVRTEAGGAGRSDEAAWRSEEANRLVVARVGRVIEEGVRDQVRIDRDQRGWTGLTSRVFSA
jgi:hypothetical protein